MTAKQCILFILLMIPVSMVTAQEKATDNHTVAEKAKSNAYFAFVKTKALDVMKAGFNAGDGYREVWIRDYNTFIELAARVNKKEVLKENLLVFFRMQG